MGDSKSAYTLNAQRLIKKHLTVLFILNLKIRINFATTIFRHILAISLSLTKTVCFSAFLTELHWCHTSLTLFLKKTLKYIGLDKGNIKTHSFRIGRSSGMYQDGYPIETIKSNGRWKLSAYKVLYSVNISYKLQQWYRRRIIVPLSLVCDIKTIKKCPRNI